MAETLPKAVGRAIGSRIKAEREKRGWRQQDLGERIGVRDHSAVGQWERGETLVGTLNLILCAEELNASLDYLIWGMGNNIDAKLMSLPAPMREALVVRFLARIEEAEKTVREHPELFTEEHVKDSDSRLRPWNAMRKRKIAEAMAKRKSGSGP